MSVKILGSPSKYVQGAGELKNLCRYVSSYGKRFFIVTDAFVAGLLSETIRESFKESAAELFLARFHGEVTYAEIDRLKAIFDKNKSDAVIGIGGGKTVDIAKVLADQSGVPVILVPTIASNNAASSALSVIYNDKGEFVSVCHLAKNPDLIFVDPEIIAKAPVRLLVSGIGDAFAAYYEARACKASNADNMHQGKATNGAFVLTELCRGILLADGADAKKAVEYKTVTKALENVIEANIYLSGVGFESNGLALAHGVAKGFTTLAGEHEYFHGEWVAFGTLVQLIAEGLPASETEAVMRFFKSVGLPLTLEDLGLKDVAKDVLMRVSEVVAGVPTAHNMPFDFNARNIFDWILLTDSIGKTFKNENHINIK